MNSVLMRSMNDSYIKNPFFLPCLPRVPSEYLAGFSFSVSLSLLSVLPVSSPACLSLPFSLSCFFFPRLHSAFFPLTFAVRGEARVRLPPFLFLPFPRPSGLPCGSGVPLRVFHPALPAFRVRPFFVSGGPLLRCLPVSSPFPPGMAPCTV